MGTPTLRAARAFPPPPSVTVAALAKRWSCSDEDVFEYLRHGQLTCHLLLHDLQVPYRQRVLNGLYRLPIKSVVSILDRTFAVDQVPFMVSVVSDEPAGLVNVWLPPPEDLRVLWKEAQRFENEVLRRTAESSRPTRKPNRRDLARERCRRFAQKVWEHDPTKTIEDVIDQPEFLDQAVMDKKGWTHDTYRKWINDLCPDRRPGRRRTKKPPH